MDSIFLYKKPINLNNGFIYKYTLTNNNINYYLNVYIPFIKIFSKENRYLVIFIDVAYENQARDPYLDQIIQNLKNIYNNTKMYGRLQHLLDILKNVYKYDGNKKIDIVKTKKLDFKICYFPLKYVFYGGKKLSFHIFEEYNTLLEKNPPKIMTIINLVRLKNTETLGFLYQIGLNRQYFFINYVRLLSYLFDDWLDIHDINIIILNYLCEMKDMTLTNDKPNNYISNI